MRATAARTVSDPTPVPRRTKSHGDPAQHSNAPQRSNPAQRGRSAIALGVAGALLLAPIVALGPSAPSMAVAELCFSPTINYPNLGNHDIVGYDDHTNVFVGGDLTVGEGTSEAEGLIVVAGQATFNLDAHYNLGLAGVGSRVPPSPMSPMLIVGQTLEIFNHTLEVGHGIGGQVITGGTIDFGGPGAALETNGGAISQLEPSALDDYTAWPANFQALSASLAALPDTGSYSTDDGLTLTGDGSTDQQVFTVAGNELGTQSAPSWLRLQDIPVGTQVVINVTGTTAVLSMVSVFVGSSMSQVNPMSTSDTIFADITSNLVWNFVEADQVVLAGVSQLVGSILVPTASSHTTVLTSTNGRVYVAGGLTQGGPGVSGLEFHAYPFMCQPSVDSGSFQVIKSLQNPDSVANVPTTYSIEYSTDNWASFSTLTVSEATPATVNGLAPGTIVRLREVPPDAITGATWSTPAWTTQSITIVADTQVSATVTNRITEEEENPVSFWSEAWVDNDGRTKVLPETGGLVVDRVWFEGLEPGAEYRFEGWLMRNDGAAGVPLGIEQSHPFTPTSADGMLLMDWPISAAVAKANAGQRIVIFLELYRIDQDEVIASDTDINSPTEWFSIAEEGEVLSNTGSDILQSLVLFGALLTVGGAGLLLVLRRRAA